MLVCFLQEICDRHTQTHTHNDKDLYIVYRSTDINRYLFAILYIQYGLQSHSIQAFFGLVQPLTDSLGEDKTNAEQTLNSHIHTHTFASMATDMHRA